MSKRDNIWKKKKLSYLLQQTTSWLEYKIMETTTMPEENMGECLGNLGEIFPTHGTKAKAIKKFFRSVKFNN